jgi:hypothetical protein
MSFDRGAGFRICGHVVRKYVSPTGKFASLVIATPNQRGGETKHDVRAFDLPVVEQIHELGVGQIVQVTGGIDNEKLTNKAKEEVKVDGFNVWLTKLTIRAITVEGSSKAPAPGKPAEKPKAKTWGDDAPAADDDVNF